MSEKFNPQEYRDELAESLKVKRALGEDGRELAKEQLELEKDTIEYKRADIQHAEDNLVKESVESSKLEWGPELGQIMSWDKAQKEVEELNQNLKEGEKPWRLPTKDELVSEFKKNNSTPAGFQSDHYWSSTELLNTPKYVYVINMINCRVNYDERSSEARVRCVR